MPPGETLGYKVRELLLPDGANPFRDWLETLDHQTRAVVQTRVLRFEMGNLGRTRSVGHGVIENKIDHGPGYRIYFGLDGKELVLLLLGGTKKTQKKDISTAHGYWKGYKTSKP